VTPWPGLAAEPLDEARRAVYAGAVFTAPGCPESSRLCAALRTHARRALGGLALREAHSLGSQGLYQAVSRARDAIAADASVLEAAAALARALGAREPGWVLDRPRLRAVGSGLWRDPRARRAYMMHRDTWYASPSAQINLWMPLLDVGPTEGFALYPAWFDAPIANDSAGFDYDAWSREVGFQSTSASAEASFPQALCAPPPRQARRVRARAGQVVVFSGAHLHSTMGHDSGRTRWSVDMRLVHTGDARAGLGAPAIDDASRGTTLGDFLPLEPLLAAGALRPST
jgi:hypothetical protein